jgi:hypothetical protein
MAKIPMKIIILLISGGLLSAQKAIVIDLTNQEAYAYEDDKLVMRGEISSGKVGYRTPTGYFKILEKDKKHVSNKYPKPNGGARMDYMMRLTNSGIAMHLGYVPNYPASHGCIRLKNGFAQKLYRWAKVGTFVEIKGKAPVRVSRNRKKSAPLPSVSYQERVEEPLSYQTVEVVDYKEVASSNQRLRNRGVVVLDDFDQDEFIQHPVRARAKKRLNQKRRVYKYKRVAGDRKGSSFIYQNHNGKVYKRRVLHFEDTPSLHYVNDPYVRGAKIAERY